MVAFQLDQETEIQILSQVAAFGLKVALQWLSPELLAQFTDQDGAFDYSKVLKWIYASNFTAYLSDRTLLMMGTVMTDLIEGKKDEAEKEFGDWFDDRKAHFFSNLKIVDWSIFLVEAFCYYILMGNADLSGFSASSAIFIAAPWSFLGPFLVTLQIAFLLLWNHWFANGNLLLVGAEAFTVVQLVSSLFLIWNSKTYDYQYYFRIWRFVSLGIAAVFSLVYVTALFAFYEAVNFEDVFHYDEIVNKLVVLSQNLIPEDGTYAIFDVLLVMILGYCLITFFPTFVIQLVIVAKELTMSQMAWSEDDDFASGTLFGVVDMSFLTMFGVSDNAGDYENYAKQFVKEYL